MKSHLTITITPESKKKLQTMAVKEHRSMANMIEWLIESYKVE